MPQRLPRRERRARQAQSRAGIQRRIDRAAEGDTIHLPVMDVLIGAPVLLRRNVSVVFAPGSRFTLDRRSPHAVPPWLMQWEDADADL